MSGCNGLVQTIYLQDSTNGSIFSPGYPYRYNNSENCQWRIIAPYTRYTQRVLIYFTMFDLEECLSCNCDSVEIYDGNNTHLLKSCGRNLPQPVYSSVRDIFMNFTSDGSRTGKGFVAHYRALNSSSGGLRFLYCLGPVQTSNFSCTEPNSFN